VVVLDLDHVRGEKVAEIARLAGDGARPARIDVEMEKCEVVCANCHRRRTSARTGSWRERAHRGQDFTGTLGPHVLRNLMVAHARLARGCVDCGETDLRTLEFDHIEQKRFPVMTAVWEGHSIERLTQEIDRCEVRCANCHRLRTAERGGHFRYLALLASDVAS
jgi:hypothetical protein